MKYLAAFILASALAPVALGDRPGNVVCCLLPPAPDVDPRTCRQSFAEPACVNTLSKIHSSTRTLMSIYSVVRTNIKTAARTEALSESNSNRGIGEICKDMAQRPKSAPATINSTLVKSTSTDRLSERNVTTRGVTSHHDTQREQLEQQQMISHTGPLELFTVGAITPEQIPQWKQKVRNRCNLTREVIDGYELGYFFSRFRL
ncbi:uncharacterized protein RSE6_14155 [Rhynchosporium secalis]|uniref:Uncharacterized protein n=1 Tax=Rhynchosporium secalis TaxID=38038 RepID=A0A1E1MUL1_RHYSE|nr:uncharacterized protein RSE6_14155 [Rhynchosporium secalis]